jgi:hypothetical protein
VSNIEEMLWRGIAIGAFCVAAALVAFSLVAIMGGGAAATLVLQMLQAGLLALLGSLVFGGLYGVNLRLEHRASSSGSADGRAGTGTRIGQERG